MTNGARHATDFVLNMPVCTFDGIIVVGGDGMVFEVIQALVHHPDKLLRDQVMYPIPIGVVPCGSGNGISASLHHDAGELVNDPVSAAFIIARGRTKLMDLWEVKTSNSTSYASLSVSWAIVSDIDTESERWRCLGSTRFAVGALCKLLSLTHYHGILAYETEDGVWRTEDTNTFTLFWALNHTHGASNSIAAPDAECDNGYIEIVLAHNAGRWEMAKGLLGLESGRHHFKSIKCRAFRLESMDPEENIQGKLSVDGELLDPCTWIECRCIKQSASFFCI